MKLGFRNKIYLGIFSLLLIFGIVVFYVVSWIMKGALLEENRKRGVSISANLAARIVEPMLSIDFLRMKTLVDETVNLSDDIFYAFVLDRNGGVLVHTFKNGFPIELKTANQADTKATYNVRLLDTGDYLVYDYAVPVLIGSNRFGTARIGLLRTKIQQAMNRLLFSTFLATGCIVIIAGFVGTVIARPVTRSVKILHNSTEQVLRGNLNVQTAPLLKKNCWQIMNCNNTTCPAYGNKHHRCWYLAGTMCPYCVEGDYAKKIDSCVGCLVYRQCSGDEIQDLAESFDSMTLSLKTNLTDLQDAQNRLKEQGQLLKTILDATPDFVSLQDVHSVYLVANKAFCQIVGRREEEIVGKTDAELFNPALAETFRVEDREIIRTQKPLVKENKIRSASDIRWLHMVKLPVFGADGKIIGLLCSGRDISEFKRVQHQLTQAQKMETIGQLTAGIAHEINTPLGIILGYAQLLLEDTKPDTQAGEDLKTVVKQAKICRKIVSDLLSFSRSTESTLGQFDLNRSLKEVITVVGHTFSLDRVIIDGRFDSRIPSLYGERERIKQVFINLFNNARDAIGTDGIIRVVSRFDENHDQALIYVADTGKGIAPDHMDKIFDPFFTTKSVDKGTGLGLSVSFGIIKEHGGKVVAQSPPSAASRTLIELDDANTVFIIYLPVSTNV